MRRLRCLFHHLACSLALAVLLPVGASSASLVPGDVLVTDVAGAKVMHLDVETGATARVTDSGNLSRPWGVTVSDSGTLYVADLDAGIVAVDPSTGNQQVVSSGGHLTLASDLVVDDDGGLIVAAGNLVRVDPQTGAQTLLAASSHAHSVDLASDGSILFAGNPLGAFFPDSDSSVYRYDRSTTTVSELGSGRSYWDIATMPSGEILGATPVQKWFSVGRFHGGVALFDPSTGFDDNLVAGDRRGIVVGPDGTLYLTADAGSGRQVVSIVDDPLGDLQGRPFLEIPDISEPDFGAGIRGIALYPTGAPEVVIGPEPSLLLLIGSVGAFLGWRRTRR